jgi:hypothetical protein
LKYPETVPESKTQFLQECLNKISILRSSRDEGLDASASGAASHWNPSRSQGQAIISAHGHHSQESFTSSYHVAQSDSVTSGKSTCSEPSAPTSNLQRSIEEGEEGEEGEDALASGEWHWNAPDFMGWSKEQVSAHEQELSDGVTSGNSTWSSCSNHWPRRGSRGNEEWLHTGANSNLEPAKRLRISEFDSPMGERNEVPADLLIEPGLDSRTCFTLQSSMSDNQELITEDPLGMDNRPSPAMDQHVSFTSIQSKHDNSTCP